MLMSPDVGIASGDDRLRERRKASMGSSDEIVDEKIADVDA